jgi:hypothetical protein
MHKRLSESQRPLTFDQLTHGINNQVWDALDELEADGYVTTETNGHRTVPPQTRPGSGSLASYAG